MNAGWVAASVRARSLAGHRVGSGACQRMAVQPTFEGARSLLAGSVYAERIPPGANRLEVERATKETVLWQVRVLAGWAPPGGSRLCRAAAAAFEAANIVALARSLGMQREKPAFFDLGSLETDWQQLRSARSAVELSEALARSPWREAATDGLAGVEDAVSLVWLTRLALVAPAARAWVTAAGALIAARLLFIDDREPTAQLVRLIGPFLGHEWHRADRLEAFRERLPVSAKELFARVEGIDSLWRAEAGLRARVEADAYRLVRAPVPGPDVVLGSLALLAVDAWRVRAALAAAALGGGSEVLDVVA